MSDATSRAGPLSPYRVLDLADLGADVIRVEPPQGDATRWMPPFAGGVAHHERSLHFLFRNANKRGVTLDLESEEGRGLFRRLVATADVVVESHDPGYMDGLGLGHEALRSVNPGLIMASISEFGSTGPRRAYAGAPIVALAMSGVMQVAGDAEKAPCNAPNAMAYDTASVYAGTGIMLALYARGESGQGQWLDISVQEAGLAGLLPWAVPMTTYGAVPGGFDHPVRGPASMTYRCQDGYVKMAVGVPRHWEATRELLEDPEDLRDPAWSDLLFRLENAEALTIMIEDHMKDRAMTDLFNKGQVLGLPITPLQPPSGFADDPHPRGRGYFVEVDHPVAGAGRYPGVPFRLSETPTNPNKPAPLLGEDNEAVYCGELGLSREALDALHARGVV